MQTVKTAAVVVFVITIMYQSYITLTTPPEPVPEEYTQDLIAIGEMDLGTDTGTPESMISTNDVVGVEQSLPESMGFNAPESNPVAPSMASLNAAIGDSPVPSMTLEPLQSPQPTAPFPDVPPATFSQPADLASSQTPSAPTKLPSASGQASSVMPNAPSSYASTGSTFQVPNPMGMPAGFESKPRVNQFVNPPTPPTPGGVTLPALPTVSDPPSVTQAGAVTPSANLGLSNAIATADRQYNNDQLREALATLSLFYNTPNITEQERSQLLARLDPLAREVIYSKRHLLTQPHRVGRSEKLQDIAADYDVPWALLANVNGVKDPTTILPGTELKVVRGPFSAQVDLTRKELTLFLGDLYAGRFPIATGTAPTPKPGSFIVQDKSTERPFYSGQIQLTPNDPNNPYGNIWIDLGGQLCIHGSPHASRPSDKGCISLAGDYADDLYGILTQGSSVTIRR